MINYLNSKRTLDKKNNNKESNRREFNKYLSSAITSEQINIYDGNLVCKINTNGIVTDIKNNDKTALDEKNLYLKLESIGKIGTYFKIREQYWISIFEEYVPTNSKKHFIIRKCNNFVMKDGKKIPANIHQFLTQSDGIKDYTSFSVSKPAITGYISFQGDIKSFDEGDTVKIGENTYKVTNINNSEFQGLTIFTALKILNEEVEEIVENNEIVGNDTVNLSCSYSFSKVSDDVWEVIDPYGILIEQNIDNGILNVKITSDKRKIGNKFQLLLKHNEEIISSKFVVLVM